MEPKKIPAALGKQCKACPWKKSVKPLEDIPGGYCVEKHANLRRTIATSPLQVTSAMACHESEVGSEVACVGWVANQLGPGTNIMLRLAALDGRFDHFETVGEQHEHFDDTIPTGCKG